MKTSVLRFIKRFCTGVFLLLAANSLQAKMSSGGGGSGGGGTGYTFCFASSFPGVGCYQQDSGSNCWAKKSSSTVCSSCYFSSGQVWFSSTGTKITSKASCPN